MQAWENKYATSGFMTTSGTTRGRHEGAMKLAIVLLGVLLLSACVLSVYFYTYQAKAQSRFVTVLETECEAANTVANNLSRSGGSESPALLGRVRAHVRAMETVNNLGKDLNGRNYIDPNVFSELYNVIDTYSNNLRAGSTTLNELTDLKARLTTLSNLIKQLR